MRFNRLLGIIVASGLIACATRAAQAQTTWVGTSGTALWNVTGNWSGGTAPVSGGTSALVFSGTTLLTSTNNLANLSASSITFANTTVGSGGFVLSGSSIALRGTISTTALSSGSVTDEIALGLVLTGGNITVTIANGGSHNLIISGSIGEDGTPRMLSRAGNGSTLFLTNTANTFSQLSSNASGGFSISQLGMAGQPSQTGKGAVISLNGSFLAYTGAGETSDKRLQVGNQSNNSNGATLSNNGSGALNLIGSGGFFTSPFTSSTHASRTLTLQGSNTGTNTIAATIADVNSGTTALALTKADAGRWILSGSNTYTGATAVSAGTLQIGGGGTTGSLNTASSITVSSGATLAFSRSNTMTQGTGFNSVLSGAGNVTQLGPGTLVLNGANTYTGTTTVTAGTLRFATQTSLYNNGTANWTAAKINVKSGATLALNVGGSGEFTQGDVTTLLTNLASSTSAATGMNAGAILGFDTTNASTPFEITTAIANTTGVSGGARGLVKLGSGTLTLSGNNTYTGQTRVSAGVLALGAATAISNQSNLLVDGGVFNLAGFSDTVGTVTLTSGSIFGSGTLGGSSYALQGGALDSVLGAGAITVSSGTTSLGSGGRFNSSSGLTISSGQLTLGGNETVASYAQSGGTLGGTGKVSAATYGLSGGTVSANLGSGTVTVTSNATLGGTSDATTLNLDSGTLALGSGSRFTSASIAVTGSSGGGLALGGNESFASLGGAANIALGTGTLTIGSANTSTTYSGILSGSGGLTKTGVGILDLMGINTFTGNTTVSAGSLSVNGQIASSVAVATGATLGGSGSVGGVLSGAGLVSPGNSPGILTASQFNPSEGLDAAFEITGLSPVYTAPSASVNDILRLTNGTPFTSSLGAGNVIDFYFNMDSVDGGTYEAGFFTTLSAGDLLTSLQSATVNYWIKDAGGTQSFNGVTYSPYSGVTLSTATVTRDFGGGGVSGSVTQFIIVPEPESIILACGGIAVAAWAARRRRS